MLSISPVYNEEFQECEKIIALDQPEYLPLVCLPIEMPEGAVLTRWEFTKEERELVSSGADLVICMLLFGKPFTPIGLEVTPKDKQPNMVDLHKIY